MTAMLEDSLMRGSLSAACRSGRLSWRRREGRTAPRITHRSGVRRVGASATPVKHRAAVGSAIDAGFARRFPDRSLPERRSAPAPSRGCRVRYTFPVPSASSRTIFARGSWPIAEPTWRPRLDRLESTLTAALERRRSWVLALFSVTYLAITSALAWHKLLWNDELFTLYIARLPTYADIWSFLASGAEQLPPTFHILARLCMKLFGVNPLALRLPEILGVGVMSLCLFVVVSRRSSAAYGLIAMLLPLVTHVFYYATEARPYGLVLGCAALSLLCWQSAADDRRRVLSVVGLA